MEYLTIILVILIILFLIYKGITPKIKRKKIIENLDEYLKKQNNPYTLEILTNDIYDLDLKVNNKHYAIKLLIVPDYSEIQINNRSTWEVKYGAGNTPGKPQTHKRYLNEISSFQAKDFEYEITKVVLIYPKPKKIVKYINECEIVFVTPKIDVYGSRIITTDNFGVFKKQIENGTNKN